MYLICKNGRYFNRRNRTWTADRLAATPYAGILAAVVAAIMGGQACRAHC